MRGKNYRCERRRLRERLGHRREEGRRAVLTSAARARRPAPRPGARAPLPAALAQPPPGLVDKRATSRRRPRRRARARRRRRAHRARAAAVPMPRRHEAQRDAAQDRARGRATHRRSTSRPGSSCIPAPATGTARCSTRCSHHEPELARRAARRHRAPPRQGHERPAGRRADASRRRPTSSRSSPRAPCDAIYLAVVQRRSAREAVIDAPIGRHPRARTSHGGRRSAARRRARTSRWSSASASPRWCAAARNRPHAPDPRASRGDRPSAGRRPDLSTRHAPAFAFPRQALHAAELSLVHPKSRETMTWRSPLPRDMKRLLDELREERWT